MTDDLRLRASARLPPGAINACGDCNLLAEADHRIANHLALLAGHVRLKSAELGKQSEAPSLAAMRLLLGGIDAQISAVSRLHRSLAIDGARGAADLGAHLHEVCAPLRIGLLGATRLTEDFTDDCAILPDQVLPITQIVAEVVTNAVRHAQSPGEAGRILVRCHKDGDGAVVVEVVDNGPGLPAGFDPYTDGGLGFRLLRALGRQLGASITFRSAMFASRGLAFRLVLPPAPIVEPG